MLKPLLYPYLPKYKTTSFVAGWIVLVALRQCVSMNVSLNEAVNTAQSHMSIGTADFVSSKLLHDMLLRLNSCGVLKIPAGNIHGRCLAVIQHKVAHC
jgi:hypothetical protein